MFKANEGLNPSLGKDNPVLQLQNLEVKN
jgi:hypothetical protein